ncbi:hypothetical protein CTKA_00991 [Chthonomonas calidirosea]|uniref:Uncharacterized protein n=1 Tax=Chthonomonas calidirosea (strain DSM 23976 / ICMP 18418 / T49) TaxID=1303518 RepID=S0ESR5_CHTCT|nr:hypothetical protein [Chthonomonas calidirosea]CCW34005.1 hypothetical protein CCALI_00167 [Chthonomonas calidirosea T49]CEK16034.1 hypothetical protein CTKA_00991 [Chthonomonas calidirosea]
MKPSSVVVKWLIGVPVLLGLACLLFIAQGKPHQIRNPYSLTLTKTAPPATIADDGIETHGGGGGNKGSGHWHA